MTQSPVNTAAPPKMQAKTRIWQSEFTVFVLFALLVSSEDIISGLSEHTFGMFIGPPLGISCHIILEMLVLATYYANFRWTNRKKSLNSCIKDACGLLLICGTIVIYTEIFMLVPDADPKKLSEFIDIMQLKIIIYAVAVSHYTTNLLYRCSLYGFPTVYLVLRTGYLRLLDYNFIAVPCYLLLFFSWWISKKFATDNASIPLTQSAVKLEPDLPLKCKPGKTLSNILTDHESVLNFIPEGIMLLKQDGQPLLINQSLISIMNCKKENVVENLFALPNKEYLESKPKKAHAIRRAKSVESPSSGFDSEATTAEILKKHSRCSSICYTPARIATATQKSSVLRAHHHNDHPKTPSKVLDYQPRFSKASALSQIEGGTSVLEHVLESKDQPRRRFKTINVERINRNSAKPQDLSSEKLPKSTPNPNLAARRLIRSDGGQEIRIESLNLENIRRSKNLHLDTAAKTLHSRELAETNHRETILRSRNAEEFAQALKETENLADLQAQNLQPQLDGIVEQLLSKDIRSKHETVGQAIQSIVNALKNKIASKSREPSPFLVKKKTKTTHIFEKEAVRKANSSFFTDSQLITNGLTCCSSFSIVLESFLQVSNSNVRYLEVKMSPFIFHGETCLILIIRDTTQKDMARRLKYQDQSKAAALASIVHDFRAPLNLITSAIEALNKKVDKQTHELLLQPAGIAAKSLTLLANDILDVYQISKNKLKLNFQEANVRKTVDECLQLFKYKAKSKKISLEVVIKEDVLTKIYTDPNRLQQILVNLLSNAFKFTEKGSIRVTVSYPSYKKIQISVKDTGIGIKEENIGKLFKAFGKIESETNSILNPHGIGLGLNISNKLARMLCRSEEHGGLKVNSIFGQGTEFLFVIDDMSPERQNQKRFSSPELMRGGSKKGNILNTSLEEELDNKAIKIPESATFVDIDEFEIGINTAHRKVRPSRTIGFKSMFCHCAKVLVVDDDEFNIMAAKALLSNLGIDKIDVAYNGQEAIDMICTKHTTSQCCREYQFVMMDCEMPILDGITATSKLTKLFEKWKVPRVKIIGVTGHSSSTVSEKCIQAGMNHVLTKPLRKEEFATCVSQFLKL